MRFLRSWGEGNQLREVVHLMEAKEGILSITSWMRWRITKFFVILLVVGI